MVSSIFNISPCTEYSTYSIRIMGGGEISARTLIFPLITVGEEESRIDTVRENYSGKGLLGQKPGLAQAFGNIEELASTPQL
jgi:hypothetical protein